MVGPQWRGRLGAAAAGAGPALTYPTASWWWLAWFGWVPLLLVVRAAPTRREGVLRAWFGVGALQCAVQYWAAPNVGPALLLLAAVVGMFWLPWGWAVHRFLAPGGDVTHPARALGAALLVIPSAWICAEAVRSWDVLGGPWAFLGTTQWKQPVMLASASLGGVWLTGFLIMAADTALACAVVIGHRMHQSGAVRRDLAYLAALTTTAAVFVAVGPVWWAVRPGVDTVRMIRVALVQPGVTPDPQARLAAEAAATDALAGQRLDLVVWGESSIGGDPARVPRLAELAAGLHTYVLANGDTPAPGSSGSFYNESVLVGPAGVIGDYSKMRLVPFGEFIPLRPVLGWIASVSRAARVNRVRGPGTVVLAAGPLAVGPLICFESAFPDMARTEVRNGAQILIYQTNTSTFQGSWAQAQHASLAAVRAAETGRPAVHAALTGDSAAFDSRGRVLAWHDASFRGAFVVDIPLADGTTPYQRTGDWMLVISALILGAAVAASLRQRKRSHIGPATE